MAIRHIIQLIVLFSALLILNRASFSQVNYNFTHIDRWAYQQELRDTGIVAFTKELISPAHNDLERLRAIFIFVTNFLKYDYEATNPGNHRINQNINDILNRKKGICWDYAQLISKMSEIADLTCIPVTGFAKNPEEPKVNHEQPDHAWNLVRIDSTYYLLDATWQSNTLNSPDYFQQTYKTDYFLTDPKLFIKNHFPSLPAFQLLDCPLDFNAFIFESIDSNLHCQFNYEDSIDAYLSLPFLDRKITEAESTYRLVPNEKNLSAWGHTLIDKAIHLKEDGDQLFEEGEPEKARIMYEAALNNFSSGATKSSLYPWQTEALGFCHLNYAQILYRINYQTNKSFDKVIDHLKQAQEILISLDSKSFSIKSALDQIEYQISVLE